MRARMGVLVSCINLNDSMYQMYSSDFFKSIFLNKENRVFILVG